MEGNRAHWLVSLLAAFACQVARAQEPGPVEAAGEHYRVLFHAADLLPGVASTLAQQAVAEADALWAVTAKLADLDAAEVRTIHVYRADADYAAAVTARPEFAEVDFFTHDGAAHVRMRPTLHADLLLPLGLPAPTADLVRLAAAWLAIAEQIPEDDVSDWTTWLVAIGAVEARTNPEHRAGVDAGWDHRRALVIAERDGGEPLLLEKLLLPDMNPRTPAEHDKLAARMAALADYLAASDPKWAKKLLQKAKKKRKPPPIRDRREERLAAIVGRNFVKAEIGFAKSLRGYAPVWIEDWPLWQPGPQRSAIAGTEAVTAVARAPAPLPAGAFALSGRVEILPGQGAPRIVFGKEGATYVAVVLWPDTVIVSVWDGKDWHDMAKGPVGRGKTAAGPYEFRVEVDDAQIRVATAGTLRLAWPHAGRQVHGDWAIHMNKGVAWFEGLRAEPLAAAKKP